MRRSIAAASAAFITAVFVAGTSAGAVVVPNGDFEAGNSGFTSDYAYTAPGGSNLYPEATYTIDSNPQNSHNLFTAFGDHGTGAGNFMIVNGAGTVETVWLVV